MTQAVAERSEHRGARERLTSPGLLALYSALVYLGIAMHVVWPVPLHLGSLLYGGPGDAIGALASLRELVEHNQLPFLPGTLPDFAAPEGQTVAWVRSLASLPGQFFLWLLAKLFGPTAGYNLFVLVGYTASGLAAFLLGRRLTGSAGAGFIAGLGLAFFPLSQLKSHGHYDMAHTWVFVLMLWRMLELQQTPTRRNGILAALSVLLAFAWSPYFILFGGVMYLTLAIAGLIIAARRNRFGAAFRAQLWPAGAALAYLIGFRLLASASETGQGLRAHGDGEFTTYAARLHEYLVPWSGSFLFGGETGPWLADRYHGSNLSETSLYVGISILLLAGYAIVQVLRRKVPEDQRTNAWVLVAICVVAGLCSAPPHFEAFGYSIPMPSYFISQVSSTWRVYSRFALVVQVALVMLAAIGVASLLKGRSRTIRASIVAALAVVVIIDLSPREMGTSAVATGPSIYDTLRGKPRGIVAEYPLGLAGLGPYDELFGQQFHDMPIINGYEAGSAAEARAVALADPSDPQTALGLAAIGVKYAIIRAVPGNADLAEPGPGFKLLSQDASGRLFEIDPTASGIPAEVSLLDGFDPPEQDPQGRFQWMSKPKAQIEVLAACTACAGNVELSLDTFGPPRQVTITGGVRPVKVTVGTLTQVKVPVRFRQSVKLTVTGDPGPIPVRDLLPTSLDPRSLVVSVRSSRFVSR